MTRRLLQLLALGAAALAASYLAEWRMLGFPDGHLTEWDRFRQGSYPAFAAALAAFAAAALWRARRPGGQHAVALAIGLALVGAAFATDAVTYERLEHGQGG